VGKRSKLRYDHQVLELEGEGDDGLAEEAQAIPIGSRDLASESVEAEPFEEARELTAGFAG